MFNSTIRSLTAAAAAALTIAGGFATAPSAKAADYCRGGQGWNMCATYGNYYDLVDITTNNSSLTIKIRCTETATRYRWTWDVVRSRNVARSFPEQAAKTYCQGRLGIS